MWVCACLCMHVSADFHEDQKEVLDLQKFELQEAVSHPTTTLESTGNWTCVCCKSTKHS